MKTIIRWLCEVLGVADTIRHEQIQDTAMRLHDAHYWMGGGITVRGSSMESADTLRIISQQLRKYDHFNIEDVRKQVFDLIEKRKHET